MTELQKLKTEARQGAKWRGHTMTNFKTSNHSQNRAFSECKKCGASVTVTTKPAPNETNICGDAIAINCRRSEA